MLFGSVRYPSCCFHVAFIPFRVVRRGTRSLGCTSTPAIPLHIPRGQADLRAYRRMRISLAPQASTLDPAARRVKTTVKDSQRAQSAEGPTAYGGAHVLLIEQASDPPEGRDGELVQGYQRREKAEKCAARL
jgi:hypothetical protein